ncbi:mas-related G-protein coupled receptor member A-like [Heterocephalus glaber]|uniref:Mas-related G-protein coupled receptor member A n=1 Tax=Heterocephalus glaber TaxID=10181 RepID=A0AAX6PGR1_HETGA|nr:mas-related G-protein coupled receptor member A [Heterocephalus glaber]XP_004851841.1 mas-related G-protein coupled receptor member A-like [Heterocephalus glaber]
MDSNTSAWVTEVTTTKRKGETAPGTFNEKDLIPNLVILISGLVGLAGNSVVLWLLGFRMRRNAFSIYILNLAAADLLFLCCHIIDSLLVVVRYFHPHVFFLPCYKTVMMFPYITGLSVLSAISTERCLSFLCPIWYRFRRPKHTSVTVCVLLWATSLLMCILNKSYCGLLDVNEKTAECLAANFSTATCLGVLVLILSGSSLAMLVGFLWGGGRQMRLTRLYVTILLTVLVFLLCGLPLGVYWFVLIWIHDDFSDTLQYGLYLASVVLSSVNSCANPLIYFFVGTFRQQPGRQTLKLLLQRALQDSPEEDGCGSRVPQGTLEMSVSREEQ